MSARTQTCELDLARDSGDQEIEIPQRCHSNDAVSEGQMSEFAELPRAPSHRTVNARRRADAVNEVEQHIRSSLRPGKGC